MPSTQVVPTPIILCEPGVTGYDVGVIKGHVLESTNKIFMRIYMAI